MIILSQDKETIVNIDTLQKIYIHDGTIRTEVNDKPVTLGTYKDRFQARDILEEIANTYAKYIKTDGGALATIDAYVQPTAYTPPKVYRMP